MNGTNVKVRKVPPIPARLVEWLEEIIPPVTVKPGRDYETMLYNAGRREVVNMLRTKLNQQREKSLEEIDGAQRV